MNPDPDLLRQLAHAEDALSRRIAAEALEAAPERKRALRSNWYLANTRAEMFMRMALEIEAERAPNAHPCAVSPPGERDP